MTMSGPAPEEYWLDWIARAQAGNRSWLRALDPSVPEKDREQALLSARGEWIAAMDGALQSLADDLQGSADWTASLLRHLRNLHEEVDRHLDETAQQLPPDLQWLTHWLESCAASGSTDLARATLDALRQWPQLGVGGRQVANLQALHKSLSTAIEAGAAYAQTQKVMLEKALKGWEQRLAARSSDPAPDREELLETWLSALSDAYEHMLDSDEHTRHLAKLNTSLQQARADALPLIEPWLHGFGIATRQDLAGTQVRLQEMRRANDEELDALRQRLDLLETHGAKPARRNKQR
ncbi:poly(R)-hydroxyalkanoic acid synthase subunit PhaE [Natronocella acetinitrilica]